MYGAFSQRIAGDARLAASVTARELFPPMDTITVHRERVFHSRLVRQGRDSDLWWEVGRSNGLWAESSIPAV